MVLDLSTWSSGYNSDIPYTYGFYRELDPGWLTYIATLKNYCTPVEDKLKYLELGCGNGYGLVMLAGLYPDMQFVGIDFLPEHISHGRRLAKLSGLTNITFKEADFADLASNWHLEHSSFDFIAAHGTYTWVSDDVRRAIVSIISKVSTSETIVYLSYNIQPGWASRAPIQHLSRLWQKVDGSGSLQAIENSIHKFKQFVQANTGMTRSLPQLVSYVDKMETNNKSYLVHEFLHDAWRPIWFDQILKDLEPAKLKFVSTAVLGDLYLSAVLPKEYKELLGEYADPTLYEVTLDVILNRMFRKDIFMKSTNELWPSEQNEILLNTQYIWNEHRDDGKFVFELDAGSIEGKAEVYEPLRKKLRQSPSTLRELVDSGKLNGQTFNQTLQAVNFLVHSGKANIYRPLLDRTLALGLNKVIIDLAAKGAPYNFLIATNIGAIITIRDTEVIMLDSLIKNDGKINKKSLANELEVSLRKFSRVFLKDQRKLETEEEIKSHIQDLVEEFAAETILNMQSLGVVELK